MAFETQLGLIWRELEPKGLVYAVCRERGADFDAALADACRQAKERGARSLCFSDRTGAELPVSFAAAGREFTAYSDFCEYTKELTPVKSPFRLKRLAPAFAQLWADMINEIFFSVPNGATYGEAELDELLADGGREAGFITDGGDPVGIYELGLTGETPEIAAVGIRADRRGRGDGGRALDALEQLLYGRGFRRVKLLVAESNAPALNLYIARGYGAPRFVSRWYAAALDTLP